jgi:SPX domain
LVPSDDAVKNAERSIAQPKKKKSRPGSSSSAESSGSVASQKQQRGDKTTERSARPKHAENAVDVQQATLKTAETDKSVESTHTVEIEKSPGEIAFFKMLHSEFKKATHFFGKAEEEFIIREERVREGMEIMAKPIMVSEKWSLLAKSLYRLYKDLLLLETFAIMTYCSFSKILKKHDKVTGYNTRNAFMANVVNTANFASYPGILEMIHRCEKMYEKVSELLLKEGNAGLYEDERLFINMIHRLNEQVMDAEAGEGIPERKESIRRPPPGTNILPTTATESKTTSSLRSLVEDMNFKTPGQVSENEEGRKRAANNTGLDEPTKKPKAE